MSDYEPDRAAMWAELEALLTGSERDRCPQPNFTVHEFADREGVGDDAARKRLSRLVEAGRLSGRKMRIDGRYTWVFWLDKNADDCGEV